MKKLILICLMVLGTVGYAQEDSSAANISETERIVDKYSGKALEAINGIAKSLQVPAEHVYKILVKQQVVNATTWLISDLLITFITIILWISWIKDKKERDNWWGIPVILSCITLLFYICNIDIIVSGYINPEYGAIKEIMNLIKQ